MLPIWKWRPSGPYMRAFGKFIGLLAFAAVAAGLSACETWPVRPLMSPFDAANGFGYSERRLDQGRIEVSYVTPFVRTMLDPEQRTKDIARLRGLAFDLAMWQAAETALREKSAAFAVRDRQSDFVVERYVETPRAPRYGLAHPLGGYRFTRGTAPDLRSAWLQGKAVLVIVLTDKAGKDGFNARETADRLAKKHARARSIQTF